MVSPRTEQSLFSDDESEDLGILGTKLECIPLFATFRWMTTCLFFLTAASQAMISGLFISAINSVQVEFDFTSTERGLIAACYSIGHVVFSMPIGHYSKRHQLWLGGGGVLVALACLVFGTSRSLWQFMLGYSLAGFGCTPLWVLGPAHIDNQIDTDKSLVPKYICLFYGFSALGVVIGVAGFMPFGNSNCSVKDALSCVGVAANATTEAPGVEPIASLAGSGECFGWAQFPPFLLIALLNLIPSFFLVVGRYRYPDHLQKYQGETDEMPAVSSAEGEFTVVHDVSTGELLYVLPGQPPKVIDRLVLSECGSRLLVSETESVAFPALGRKALVKRLINFAERAQIPHSLYQETLQEKEGENVGCLGKLSAVLTNPRCMLLIAGTTADQFTIDSLSAFLTKFIEQHHGRSQATANVIVGAIIPTMFVGTLLGGYIPKHYGWGIKNTLALGWSTTLISVVFCALLVVPSFGVFVATLILGILVVSISSAPLITAIERVVPEYCRELALGVNNIIMKAGGGVCGPVVFGVLVDKWPCSIDVIIASVAAGGFAVCGFSALGAWIIHKRSTHPDFGRPAEPPLCPRRIATQEEQVPSDALESITPSSTALNTSLPALPSLVATA